MMFFKRLLIVSILIGLCAYLIGNIFDNLYKKRWSEFFFDKTEELVNGKTSYDIILLGNSKIHFGINPYYLDSVTKFNSYNFGYGGSDAEEMLLTTSVYLEHRKPPKLVIMCLEMYHFIKHNNLKTNYFNLYYLNDDSIQSKLNSIGYMTHTIKMFPFIKYSFFDEYNRTSIFINKEVPKFDHNIYKGFINIHRQLNTNPIHLDLSEVNTTKVSDESVENIKKIITIFQKAGSTVIIIDAPSKSTSSKNMNSYKHISDSLVHQMSNIFNVKYITFNNLFHNDDYYPDAFHVNEQGSRIFSRSLGDSINKYFHTP